MGGSTSILSRGPFVPTSGASHPHHSIVSHRKLTLRRITSCVPLPSYAYSNQAELAAFQECEQSPASHRHSPTAHSPLPTAHCLLVVSDSSACRDGDGRITDAMLSSPEENNPPQWRFSETPANQHDTTVVVCGGSSIQKKGCCCALPSSVVRTPGPCVVARIRRSCMCSI
jgi:hypothetical protein